MNYRYFLSIVITVSVVLLAGCGKSVPTQSISMGLWGFDIADSYTLVADSNGDILTYRSGSGDVSSIIQMSQSRVNSGVSIQQMSSLNLQKLSLTLPGFELIDQSSRSIDCTDTQDGEIVSFITQQGDDKVFHSQYYTMVDSQGYIWSVSSDKDITRKTLIDIINSASCT